jgi:hypothetical protein
MPSVREPSLFAQTREKQKPAPFEQTSCPEWALVVSSDAGF